MAQNVNPTGETQKLMLEGGKRLTLSCVESVDGFNEEIIKLSLGGAKLIINGSGLKITSFNKSTGAFTAEGTFNGIKYGEKKGSFFKRLFG